jgi:hypothetical protein
MVPVPKCASSPIVDNYSPISITHIISKDFERLIAIRFSSYLEHLMAKGVRAFALLSVLAVVR